MLKKIAIIFLVFSVFAEIKAQNYFRDDEYYPKYDVSFYGYLKSIGVEYAQPEGFRQLSGSYYLYTDEIFTGIAQLLQSNDGHCTVLLRVDKVFVNEDSIKYADKSRQNILDIPYFKLENIKNAIAKPLLVSSTGVNDNYYTRTDAKSKFNADKAMSMTLPFLDNENTQRHVLALQKANCVNVEIYFLFDKEGQKKKDIYINSTDKMVRFSEKDFYSGLEPLEHGAMMSGFPKQKKTDVVK